MASSRGSGWRDPTSPGVRALAEARKALAKHQDAIDEARQTLDANIERGRDSLRSYKAPLSKAVEDRRGGLEREMESNDHFDAPLVAAKRRTRRHRKD